MYVITLGQRRLHPVVCVNQAAVRPMDTSSVRPMLEYATAAWDPYRAKDVNRLEMVQRRTARFVKSG